MTAQERLGSDERRRQIVEAAMPLFASKGFTATTTREIARSAGVSEALLYKYFPSKDHLFKELDSFCTPETSAISDGLASMGPSTATLVTAVYFMTRLMLRGQPGLEERTTLLKRLMAQSLLDDGQFARQFLEAKFVPYIPALELALKAAVQAGDVEPGTTPERALVVFAHHVPFSILLFGLPDRRPLSTGLSDGELLVETVRFVLRGLGLRREVIDEHFHPAAAAEWFEQAFAAVAAADFNPRPGEAE
ncbi:MAG: TetR/AcrR family transcriptional regulator [Bdellovibrionales bacterium]|nr:TetR/AcrR family transcriptional regulator [Bdellovibrionales bacterium]